MSNEILLQKERVATGKGLSRRNFQITMTHLRGALHWKKVHLEALAMLTWYRLVNLVLRLRVWHKPCEPPMSDETVNPNVQIEGLRAFAQSLSNAGLGWFLDCKT